MSGRIRSFFRKENRKKIVIASVLLALVLFAAAAGTTYLSARYRTQQRLAGEISYSVNSDYSFEILDDYSIRNTGATSVWFRAFVVCNRVDEQGNILYSDETFTVAPGEGWSEGGDGAFYYADAVDPDGTTRELVLQVMSSSDRTEEIQVTVIAEVLDVSLGESAEGAFAAAGA